MDKKYIIDFDENGLINWVGVYTTEGLIYGKEIVDKDNHTSYLRQMRELNSKFGDFFKEYFNRNYTIIDRNMFIREDRKSFVKKTSTESEPVLVESKEESKEPEVVKEATPLVEKINSKSFAKAAMLALTIAVATAGLSFAKDGKVLAKAKKFFRHDKQTTIEKAGEEVVEVANTVQQDNLQSKSLDELIAMLEQGEQQEAFNKIIDVQDYFNEVAAPTVKQEDKQLYLTFDESAALYIYANSHAKSIEDFKKIFGKSKIVLLNPETDEYEEMTAETIAANYLSACLNLNYYYQLGATEESGVSKIFENKKEAELFESFEEKLLEYNRTGSKEVANEIREQYENAFMSGNIDSV